MIVLDVSDLKKNVIAPLSSPIGSSLAGNNTNDSEIPKQPNLGTSRIEGKGLEQINTKLEKLLVKPKRRPKTIKFTL